MTDNDLAYRYNWQDEAAKSRGRDTAIVDWATIVMTVETNRDSEQFEQLSERTKGFTECEMRVTLNGIEVSAKQLLTRLEEALDYGIESGVEEKIKEFGYFSELNDAISRAQTAAKEALYAELAKIGIEIPDGDDLW